MKFVLAPVLLMALTAASAPPISVIAGTGDWSHLPQIRDNGSDHVSKNLMLALNDIAVKHECALPGFQGTRFNFNMSFAALFDADGNPLQIVIPKLNCPRAEAVIGGTLKEALQGGDYRPTAKTTAWYQGIISFDIDEASH
ncbi:MAG: hypothetical protein HOP95_05660 [Sphingomonas sp.]|nr:hypothetical protein [Sphingomonas sp.]